MTLPMKRPSPVAELPALKKASGDEKLGSDVGTAATVLLPIPVALRREPGAERSQLKRGRAAQSHADFPMGFVGGGFATTTVDMSKRPPRQTRIVAGRHNV